MRVSRKNQINDCLFGTGGKNNINSNLPLRKSGCAALDMAYVAAGRYDGYFQDDLNIWDIAAGIILINNQEAYLIKLIFLLIKYQGYCLKY